MRFDYDSRGAVASRSGPFTTMGDYLPPGLRNVRTLTIIIDTAMALVAATTATTRTVDRAIFIIGCYFLVRQGLVFQTARDVMRITRTQVPRRTTRATSRLPTAAGLPCEALASPPPPAAC